tara:strand:+ start:144873 stop:145028 length:156 start_codon:yes stop_codon:yes gene_type:complete
MSTVRYGDVSQPTRTVEGSDLEERFKKNKQLKEGESSENAVEDDTQEVNKD